MWVLTGPFDGELGGAVSSQKSKLLKTGTAYPLGRKDKPLSIASKKVSHDHGEFVVGSFSTDDVDEPSSRPTLEWIYKKDKAMRVIRGDEELICNPLTSFQLEDNDAVVIVTGIQISVKWISICCYYQSTQRKLPFSLEDCASLGIHLLITPNSLSTHHLTNSYTANASIASSLISATHFVKPDWLHEVIRLGMMAKNHEPSNGISLEESFSLPQTSKFRPSFSPSLFPPQKIFKVWEPNEERLHIFKNYRFICTVEKPKEVDGSLRDMITRGGGLVESFDIRSGVSKFHQILARGHAKQGQKVVLVGDPKAIQIAIGLDTWNILNSEAKAFKLQFRPIESIVQSVINVNPSALEIPPPVDPDDIEIISGVNSSLPNFIPNSMSEEPSHVPNTEQESSRPRSKLVRRATSRQPSQEPSHKLELDPRKELNEQDNMEAPRPRRALTRRVNAGKPVVTGLNDPSVILDAAPDGNAKPPYPALSNLTVGEPVPVRSTRLKRRVGSADPESGNNAPLSLDADKLYEEPPLKKFKALFDASHPDKLGVGSVDDVLLEIQPVASQTQTQTQTQTGMRSNGGRSLRSTSPGFSILREEEEETQSGAGAIQKRGTKRGLESIDEDVEMDEVAQTLGSMPDPSLPAIKKRAMQSINAVERYSTPVTRGTSKPPSKASVIPQSGASPGKPDTDPAFLKAIASTKRGKKSEDLFDREFNNLRISRPQLDRDEPEDEWAVLADFGDDSGVRGNFMVITEMDICTNNIRRRNVVNSTSLNWEGKSNFKKFKKKISPGMRAARVELVVNEENDFGMGAAYWKGGNSQSQSQNASQKQKLVTAAQILSESASENEETRQARKQSIPSPISSTTTFDAPRKPVKKAKSASKSKRLFFDSEEEQEQINALDEDEETRQTQGGTRGTTTRRTQRTASKTKPAPIIVDDDSDDAAVFKGFKGKKRVR